MKNHESSQVSRASTILRVILFLTLPTTLVASIRPSRPDDLVPIDNLQEGLLIKHHSKQAKNLNLAFNALQKKKYADAISMSSKANSDKIFSDYAFWISASAHRGLAQELITLKNYASALQASQKAISLDLQIENKNPYSPFIRELPREIGLAELLAGEAHWGKKKWVLSEEHFERAFQRLQGQNSLHLVQPNWVGEYAEACKKKESPLCAGWLQKFLSLFSKKPDDVKTITTLFPGLLEKAKLIKSTGKVTVGYKATDLDQVAFELAMKLYLEESYSQAAKSFGQFLDDYPRSAFRFRARYWLGQAFHHLKEHERAQKVYLDLQQDSPLTYYGFLASTATGRPIDSPVRATLPMASDNDPALSPQEIFHLKRAQNLIAEKAYDLACYELKGLKARDTLSSPFLLYLAMLNYSAKNYNSGFQLISELIQRGYEGAISSFGLRVIFPVDYMDLIKKNAQEQNLDPLLVLSLIKQESAFDEEAGSSAGAMGLMQLMPMTALDTDSQIKLLDLLEPSKNIAVGTKYLKKLLVRFNGNIVYALAGYNAGPNAVDRWIRESGGKRGMLEFIESIPYKETREYVGSIIRNYYWYSRRLGSEAPKSLDYFWNTYGPPEPTKQQNGNA